MRHHLLLAAILSLATVAPAGAHGPAFLDDGYGSGPGLQSPPPRRPTRMQGDAYRPPVPASRCRAFSLPKGRDSLPVPRSC